MRAYQLPKGGAGIDALIKVERPDLKPAYRQVVVKVKACSLNFRDLGIVRGTCRMPVRENLIPLSDGAGEVIEVGPGVARVKVGDRVAGCFFQRWAGGEAPADVHASALGGGIDGMLAEYAVLEEDGVVKIPAHLSLEEGATLPCAGVTVWNAMMEHAKLVAGQTVLLQGTGGVSIFGLQLARMMGIQMIITSSSDDKIARASGPATELNPGLIFARRANVQGISVGSMQMFEAMSRAIAASGIKPVIDKVFPFDEAQAAYRHMASGAHFGKIVIRVA